MQKQREGVIVKPQCRLAGAQIELVDAASRELLQDPGLLCYNVNAAKLFKKAGAQVEDAGEYVRIRMPGILVDTHWRMKPAGLCTPHTRNIGKLGRDCEATSGRTAKRNTIETTWNSTSDTETMTAKGQL